MLWVQSNVPDGTVYLEKAQFQAYLPELSKPEFDDVVASVSPWCADLFSQVCDSMIRWFPFSWQCVCRLRRSTQTLL